MKRIFILTMLAAGVLSATKAQIRKIPSAVTDAFASRYPHAEKSIVER